MRPHLLRYQNDTRHAVSSRLTTVLSNYTWQKSSAYRLEVVSGVASFITIHEQLQWNRGCFFPHANNASLWLPFLRYAFKNVNALWSYGLDKLIRKTQTHARTKGRTHKRQTTNTAMSSSLQAGSIIKYYICRMDIVYLSYFYIPLYHYTFHCNADIPKNICLHSNRSRNLLR